MIFFSPSDPACNLYFCLKPLLTLIIKKGHAIMTKAKTHQSELERLASLEQRAESGGGQKAGDRQRERGKLTARERLNLLFDLDSFVEVNKLAESQSIDLCPGCHGSGRIRGHNPRTKNLQHNG
jgi:acetyl-CoA carboxylase carboxyltransferase component